MAIQINEDGSVTITGEEAQTLINGLVSEVSSVPVSQALSTELEQIVSTEGPDTTQTTIDGIEILVQTVSDSIVKTMYQVDHGILIGLTDDDHPQYHNDARGDVRYTPISHITGGSNPHGLVAAELPGLSSWGTRVTAADLAFIEANIGNDAIPSTRIENVVAGKIAAGTMSSRVSLSDAFVASANGSVLNDDQAILGLGASRIEMGFIADALGTYMIRQHNGYADNHPSYVSNFSIDQNGNVKIAGDVQIGSGNGIANLSDAGALATRDTSTFFSPTAPSSPIAGDLWYDTDDGNEPYRYNGSTWQSVKDSDITVALGAIDGKIGTYWQSTEPTGLSSANNGDVWFDTSDGNHIYVYDDGAVPKWQDAQDSQIATAIGDAATAQSTADGKVTTYVAATGPLVIEGIGDLFYNTTNKILYRANTYPVNGTMWDSAEWDVVGNGIDDTSLLTDSANLGGTAVWTGVTGTGKPADNADVTNVGGHNLVIRGLTSPNSTLGSVTAGIAGVGGWSFTLPDSSSATQQMVFDLPTLKVDTDYILTFFASPSTSTGTDMEVDLYSGGQIGQTTVAMTSTSAIKYSVAFNSSAPGIATAVLRFSKYTGSTNPTESITVYDVKFEEGTQATDWTPYDLVEDLEYGVTISDGGITLDSGGALKSLGKDSWDDTTAGFFLGWDTTASAYTFAIGNATSHVTWDGTNLTLTGSLAIGTGESVSSGKTSYADTTAGFWIGSDSGTPKINVGNSTEYMKWTGTALEMTGSLNLGTGGQTLKAGQTAFDTGTGFFLGYESSAYKLSVGNSSGNKMTWNGSELVISGILNASTIMNKGSFLTAAAAGSATTLYVADTTDFASSGTAYVIDPTTYNPDQVTYTGKTATSLTGVSGLLFGVATGSAVIPANSGDENVFLWDVQDKMYFFGDAGAGIEPGVIIGKNSAGGGSQLLQVGSLTSGNALTSIRALTDSGHAVIATSKSGNGITASSSSGYAGRFYSGSGYYDKSVIYAEALSYRGIGVHGYTQSNLYGTSYGVLGRGMGNACIGVAGNYKQSGGYGPLYGEPHASSGTPTHAAPKGTIWIGSSGELWVNNNGSTGWSAK